MPKMTHLELVQSVLSDMDSDTVNSWAETVESEQVGRQIKRCYYEFINKLDPDDFKGMITLTARGNTAQPTHFDIQDAVSDLIYVKYDISEVNTTKDFATITYKDPIEFIEMTLDRDPEDTTVDVVQDDSGRLILIRNDKAPTYWTTMGNDRVIFDSYDNTLEATMQSSKVLAYGTTEPTYTLDDDFVPVMNVRFFPAFLSECTAACFNNVKQMPNAREEKRARVGGAYIQNYRKQVRGRDIRNDYGRKRR